MQANIKCPNCAHEFELSDTIKAGVQKELRAQMKEWQDTREKELQQQSKQQLQEEVLKANQETQQKLMKAEEDAKLKAEQLKQAEQKEMTLLQEKAILEEKQQQAAIEMERKMLEQKKAIEEKVIKNQEELFLLRSKESQEQIAQKEQYILELKQQHEADATLRKEQQNKLHEMELHLVKERQAMEEQKQAQQFELEKQLLEKKKEIEIAAQAKMIEENEALKKEHQIQNEQQTKLIEELKRKAEQGSMQLQGESQEILLEELLQEQFPFDLIEPVAKGVRGADCMQIIRNNFGQDCGSIIYESKKTKTWLNEWVEKLKADMRTSGADVAILVTQVFPKDITRFAEKDGIWICNFSEVAGVASIIRQSVLKIHQVQKNQENKGEKMQMLYNYLTGNEFRGQIEAILEGFMSIKNGITKERVQMEKIWKEREKQLEKVLLNTSGLYGSVKGIAGASVANIPLLEAGDLDDKDE